MVVNDRDELLLVLRGREPEAGCWSVPGGRVHLDESLRAAAARETFEETGLVVDVGALLWRCTLRIGATVYDLFDFEATVTGGTLRAGDDAVAVRWCPVTELERLPLSADLWEHLVASGVVSVDDG